MLIAPLHPTSLVQAVFNQIEEYRFRANAKARQAGDLIDGERYEYPGLAVVYFGGDNPQNISQLNSERHGKNYLLASIPPSWNSTGLKPLLHQGSLFTSFGRRPEVKKLIHQFKTFIKSNPPAVFETRQKVRDYLSNILEEFFLYTAAIRELHAGWTLETNCLLSKAEKIWLDPVSHGDIDHDKDTLDSGKVLSEIALGFALWLNDKLEAKGLPLGDDQAQEWARALKHALETELRDAFNADENFEVAA